MDLHARHRARLKALACIDRAALLPRLVCFTLACLVLPPSTGVTHLKLQDDGTIVAPAETDVVTNANQQESGGEYFIPNLGTTDPEFAVLLRHASGLSAGSGGGGGGGKERVMGRPRGNMAGCPVVVTLNSQPVGGQTGGGGQCVEKPRFSAPRNPDGKGAMSLSAMANAHPSVLSCGEMVEFTVYDFLKGLARRAEHKPYPEPEVAMIFKKTETDTAVDLFEVEMGLRRAYQENPASLTVLNQIGNFWRIKGNTQLAIECFRKALSIAPDHPDLLLNLARVLFNLKYYDDAVFLAKRSLHAKSSDHHAWLQYFTLGEVYKALEKYEEAAFYFRRSLDLNPGLQVAEIHLRELGMDQQHSVNAYTLLIIFALISFVLVLVYYLLVAVSASSSPLSPPASVGLQKK